jgi:hypothetical protein
MNRSPRGMLKYISTIPPEAYINLLSLFISVLSVAALIPLANHIGSVDAVRHLVLGLSLYAIQRIGGLGISHAFANIAIAHISKNRKSFRIINAGLALSMLLQLVLFLGSSLWATRDTYSSQYTWITTSLLLSSICHSICLNCVLSIRAQGHPAKQSAILLKIRIIDLIGIALALYMSPLTQLPWIWVVLGNAISLVYAFILSKSYMDKLGANRSLDFRMTNLFLTAKLSATSFIHEINTLGTPALIALIATRLVPASELGGFMFAKNVARAPTQVGYSIIHSTIPTQITSDNASSAHSIANATKHKAALLSLIACIAIYPLLLFQHASTNLSQVSPFIAATLLLSSLIHVLWYGTYSPLITIHRNHKVALLVATPVLIAAITCLTVSTTIAHGTLITSFVILAVELSTLAAIHVTTIMLSRKA